MGKPKMIGMNKVYIPNSKADQRHGNAAYWHGKKIAERPQRMRKEQAPSGAADKN